MNTSRFSNQDRSFFSTLDELMKVKLVKIVASFAAFISHEIKKVEDHQGEWAIRSLNGVASLGAILKQILSLCMFIHSCQWDVFVSHTQQANSPAFLGRKKRRTTPVIYSHTSPQIQRKEGVTHIRSKEEAGSRRERLWYAVSALLKARVHSVKRKSIQKTNSLIFGMCLQRCCHRVKECLSRVCGFSRLFSPVK